MDQSSGRKSRVKFSDPLKEQLLDESSSVCQVCKTSSYPIIPMPSCAHEFCECCIQLYLEVYISDMKSEKIPCMSENCSVILEVPFIYQYLSYEMIQKYEKFSRQAKLEQDPYIRWCPRPDCEGYGKKLKSSLKMKCNECHFAYCFQCSEEWHEGKCPSKDNDLHCWISKHKVKFCPRCKRHVEKLGGCQHMQCPKCGYHWCWNCGMSVQEHKDFLCFLGKSKLQLYWYVILAMIFAPFVLPFAVPLFVAYYTEVAVEVDQNEHEFYRLFFRKKWFFYALLTLASPFIVAMGISLAGFIIGFLLFGYLINNNHKALVLPLVFLGLFVGACIEFVLLLALFVVLIVLPFIGLGYLMVKVYFVCRFRKFKEPNSYPRLLV